ncbi:DUF3017 domain-containing protein [Mariniluteicoccus flavus]
MGVRDTAFKTAASARAKSLSQWPLLVVIGGELVGLLLVVLDHWRWGTAVIGASLCLGALERAFLPRRVAGLLQVRTRTVDVIVLTGMGLAIIVLSWWVPARV